MKSQAFIQSTSGIVCGVGVRGVWAPEAESPVTHEEPQSLSLSPCASKVYFSILLGFFFNCEIFDIFCNFLKNL